MVYLFVWGVWGGGAAEVRCSCCALTRHAVTVTVRVHVWLVRLHQSAAAASRGKTC